MHSLRHWLNVEPVELELDKVLLSLHTMQARSLCHKQITLLCALISKQAYQILSKQLLLPI